MALTTQDFTIGTDFTGISPITAGDLNNAVNLANPTQDSSTDGKGLTLVTKDTALDTPVVPDVVTTFRWRRYLWVRIPHVSATIQTPKLYAYNVAATSDPTTLKWVQIIADTASLQAEIDAALAAAQAAQANSTVALTTANAANVTAANASIAAADAHATAISASAAAATANAAAIAAQSTATTANTNATAALTAADAKRDITAALNPGASGQKPRTNIGATAVEWYDEYKQYVKVSQSLAKNTSPQVLTSADWTKLTINQEDHDSGALVTLAANIITFAVPGIYRVSIPVSIATTSKHKAALVDTDANTVLLLGNNAGANTGDHVTSISHITGLITVTSVVKNVAIYAYATNAGYLGGGPAGEINVDYPIAAGVATKEVYLTAEFWKIN